VDKKEQLSDAAANVVENLACRVAERNGGRIAANHLVPYLPLSLSVIKSCLEDMADGTSVVSHQTENGTEYEFVTYRGKPGEPGLLRVDSCVSCDADLATGGGATICASCSQTLREELNALADATGWPAQAVYEHEILYIGANQEGPLHAEMLAGHSRYTLRNMTDKLDRLSAEGFVSQELDVDQGAITYTFPEIAYPKERYRENLAVIRAYPASVAEEVELKVIRILSILGVLLLGLFVLAFMHVPFPLLVAVFALAIPVVSVRIWRRRSPTEED